MAEAVLTTVAKAMIEQFLKTPRPDFVETVLPKEGNHYLSSDALIYAIRYECAQHTPVLHPRMISVELRAMPPEGSVVVCKLLF